jgi:hypothetical protein
MGMLLVLTKIVQQFESISKRIKNITYTTTCPLPGRIRTLIGTPI